MNVVRPTRTGRGGGGGRPPLPWRSMGGEFPEKKKGLTEMIPFGKIIAGIFAVIVLLTIGGSFYTIDQTQRGVLLRNGAFVEVVKPGLRFKWPFIESVEKIDMQTHTKTYGYDSASKRDTMEAYSADGQPAYLRVSVTLHVSPDKVEEMYNRFKGDYEAAVARTVAPQVFARTKVVFGQYSAARAISSRAALNADTAKALGDAMAYDPVFSIETVQIENISFSQAYINAIEQQKQAEVEVAKFKQNLEREKVNAEIALTQATGRANSVRAEAQAQADAIRLKGDAEASAIEARAKALGSNPALVSLTQAEKWNGVLPATMVPGGSVPMLALGR